MRAIFLLLLAAGLAHAQFNASALDKIAVSEIVRQKIPGMAVVAVREDRVIYAQGFGVASVESKTPVSPDTFFQSGLERIFLAIAAVELSEQGRLRMDAPLGNYLVGLDEKEAALTVEQVLNPAPSEQDAALAGRLIEVIRGKPFPAVLDETVFGPLGMKSTTFVPTVAMTYPLAVGHTADKKVLRPVDGSQVMFSSGNELARFLMAFVSDGRVGEGKLGDDQANRQQALPAFVLTALQTPGGIGFEPASGGHLLQRVSAAPGFSSALLVAPEFKTGLIVLTNRTGADPLAAARKLMDAAIPVRYPSN